MTNAQKLTAFFGTRNGRLLVAVLAVVVAYFALDIDLGDLPMSGLWWRLPLLFGVWALGAGFSWILLMGAGCVALHLWDHFAFIHWALRGPAIAVLIAVLLLVYGIPGR